MSAPKAPTGASLAELHAVMQRLLGDDGCPWDREQTLATLRPYLIEECFEVLEALERDDPAGHCDELGDLLMQIVFQSALRAAAGQFDLDDVVHAIVTKLVRRHPHVFADAVVADADGVVAQWDEIKRREKGATGDERTLAGVPLGLPALVRAHKLSARAAKVGFDWPDVAGCRAKVDEELGEIDRAVASGDPAAIEHELGDLLFAATSLCRKLKVDAETALRAASRRFEGRFAAVEDRLRARGKRPAESDLVEMDALWEAVKRDGAAIVDEPAG